MALLRPIFSNGRKITQTTFKREVLAGVLATLERDRRWRRKDLVAQHDETLLRSVANSIIAMTRVRFVLAKTRELLA